MCKHTPVKYTKCGCTTFGTTLCPLSIQNSTRCPKVPRTSNTTTPALSSSFYDPDEEPYVVKGRCDFCNEDRAERKYSKSGNEEHDLGRQLVYQVKLERLEAKRKAKEAGPPSPRKVRLDQQMKARKARRWQIFWERRSEVKKEFWKKVKKAKEETDIWAEMAKATIKEEAAEKEVKVVIKRAPEDVEFGLMRGEYVAEEHVAEEYLDNLDEAFVAEEDLSYQAFLQLP